MTETEKKALALLNECAGQEVYGGWVTFDPNQSPCTRALCRAIEQHEAFRQEVSDVVESLCNTVLMSHGHREMREMLSRRFIIPKPDPLVEVIADYKRTKGTGEYATNKDMAAALRAALAARGLEIREKQP